MDKDSLIEEIEMVERLEAAGLMQTNKDDFLESVFPEDRTVGFIGSGDNLKIFCIGENKMESLELNYKDLLEDFPELTWRRQRLGEDLEIGADKNTELLENYESFVTRKKGIKEAETRTTQRSYKPL